MTAFVVTKRGDRPVNIERFDSVADADADYRQKQEMIKARRLAGLDVELFAGTPAVLAKTYPHIFAFAS